MTDQEEQAMIARAKAGDPQANYEMCLWALEQAEAEPGEERWKRLAAKCLVESAQAGYQPAQKKMEELIENRKPAARDEDQAVMDDWDEEPEPSAARPAAPAPLETPDLDDGFSVSEPSPAPAEPVSDEAFWTSPPQNDDLGGEAPPENGEKPDPLVSARAAVDRLRAAFGHGDQEQTDAPAPEPSDKKSRFSLGGILPARSRQDRAPAKKPQETARTQSGGFMDKVRALLHKPSSWSEATWKKIEIICGAVAVVMIILIVVLIVTGNKKNSTPAAAETPSLTAETAATPEPTIEPFPTTTLRNEISNATTLDYFPLDEQFLSASETKQVKAEGGLNLRRGPASTYEAIRTLSDGLSVDVYATKADDSGMTWALVNAGGTWGWVSMDYLQ